ncbi:endoglucanase [Chitinispirillum alkaliphilum]|nr:endoglucanase [Chitinispirillum alkaliphilum]
MNCLICLIVVLSIVVSHAGTVSEFITIDQFGYRPQAAKIAVIRDPVIGFDSLKTFTPGAQYAVMDNHSGEQIFTGTPVEWNEGRVDSSSGDRAWWFDFSSVAEEGTYYILDVEQDLRSHSFVIAPTVYDEILKHAVRTFFYQRAGFEKEARYAGEGWADGASHVGPLQDMNARCFFDQDRIIPKPNGTFMEGGMMPVITINIQPGLQIT